MDVGPVELLIVLAVVLLLFGSKKLPDLARGMGQAAKEFRSGLNEESSPAADGTTKDAVKDSIRDSIRDTGKTDD